MEINSNVALAYSAGVALQELDLLVQLDVVGPQAVQLVLQGLHGLLHGAILLQVQMEETNSRGFTSPQTRGRGRENRGGGALTTSSSWLRERNLSRWLEMIESSESI